jgi:predicted N-acetyltransferase YhbS
MEIHRLSAEERLTSSFPIQAYAFDASPMSAEATKSWRDYLPYNEGNRTLVAREGERTLAAASAIPMRQNLRGAVLPMAGIASVATHPAARRQGHVRALLHQLLDEMRDEGHLLSALYPFRPSFYARFGYVGLPKARTATFAPEDLGRLLRAELPGTVSWERIGTGYPGYRAFTERLLADRHGFSVFPEHRAVRLRDADEHWLLIAESGGDTVGALTYRIEEHGGTLAAGDLLTTGPLGRALLLQFLARHVDQVSRISLQLPADELPELWETDLAVRTEAVVARPHSSAPMARLLSLDALHGLPAGPGRVRIELVDDRYLSGGHVLDGADGRLDVRPDRGTATTLPVATLTSAGLAGLAYGVLDPVEVGLRGLGSVDPAAGAELARLFPRRLPYLFADF